MKHQVGIYDLLKNAQIAQNKTIAAITHDINLAVQYCDEILLLDSDNNYKFGTPYEVLTEEKIRDVFGVKIQTVKIAEKVFFMPIGNHFKESNKV